MSKCPHRASTIFFKSLESERGALGPAYSLDYNFDLYEKLLTLTNVLYKEDDVFEVTWGNRYQNTVLQISLFIKVHTLKEFQNTNQTNDIKASSQFE
jgi:hypothetical protein